MNKAEATILALMVQAYAINAEIEAMKAENDLREINNQSPAYSENNFAPMAVMLNNISVAIQGSAEYLE